jgi:hypothetical protein
MAVWGMDIFNKYLRGKPFILYTEHKPLENLSHFHNEMLNRLQLALLEHNVIIQFKKGSNMPANYLSRHQTKYWPLTHSKKIFWNSRRRTRL